MFWLDTPSGLCAPCGWFYDDGDLEVEHIQKDEYIAADCCQQESFIGGGTDGDTRWSISCAGEGRMSRKEAYQEQPGTGKAIWYSVSRDCVGAGDSDQGQAVRARVPRHFATPSTSCW